MAGEGEGGAEEEGTWLEGPSGEGGDEARGVEGVLVILMEESRVGGEVRGDKAERVVLCSDMEEVVVLGLTLFHDSAAGGALRDGAAGGRGCAPALRRRAVGTLH